MSEGFSRRFFLRRAGAASAAALVVGVPTLAHAEAESPELLQLGAQLHRAALAFTLAKQHKADCRAAYLNVRPDIPESIVVKASERLEIRSSLPKDCDGQMVFRNGRTFYCYRASALREALKYADGRTLFGRRLRTMLRDARAYESVMDQAAEASGLMAAVSAYETAEHELQRVIRYIGRAEARTMAGVLIKARAVQAIALTGEHWRAGEGDQLATAVLAIVEGCPA